MLIYIFSVFIIIFGLSSSTEHVFPVTTCKRDANDYSACLLRFLKETWPQFVKGFPELDLPSLDPIFSEYVNMRINDSNLISGEVTFLNTTGIGLSKTHFFDVRTRYLNDVFDLEIDIQIPNLFVESFIKVNGTVNQFKIFGAGNINVTIDDIRGTWYFTGHVVNDTWNVEHFNQAPSIGKLKMHIDIFDDKQLNQFVETFVNEYWPQLYRMLLSYMSSIWDAWVVNNPAKILLKIPFSKAFP